MSAKGEQESLRPHLCPLSQPSMSSLSCCNLLTFFLLMLLACFATALAEEKTDEQKIILLTTTGEEFRLGETGSRTGSLKMF